MRWAATPQGLSPLINRRRLIKAWAEFGWTPGIAACGQVRAHVGPANISLSQGWSLLVLAKETDYRQGQGRLYLALGEWRSASRQLA
jgi:hypothetical protein